MARKRTLGISAINVRVHTRHTPDEYVDLWRAMIRLKRAKTRGYTALMIGTQRPLDGRDPRCGFYGYLYRFVNIDPEDPWFDIEEHKKADPDEVAEVHIPAKLKPGLREFPYLFDVQRHRLYFLSGGTDGGLSPGLVKSLVDHLATMPRIVERFGDVDTTIVMREGALDELLAWPEIRQIRVVLERPNPTEFDDDESFYERLQRRHLKREEHRFVKAPEAESITPDSEMVAMFERAVTDGVYMQRGVTPEGKVEDATSEQYPRQESGKYDPDAQLQSDAFVEIVRQKFG